MYEEGPKTRAGTPAVLASVWLPTETEAQHRAALVEMQRLMKTLGFVVKATVTQKRQALAAAAVLGEGKLKELAALTGGTGVVPSGATRKVQKAVRQRGAAPPASEPEPDEAPEPIAEVVVVDNDISPSQMRNLERAVGVEVLDRTGVIIEIFHRHAQTREARLQVEMARLRYEAPRLREKPSRGDHERSGAVGNPGESKLELDRRRIRDRLTELRRELDAIAESDGDRRARRQEHAKVALVGYTNAGKSSLMRGLTGSEVLVADQLFATLDTTVRPLWPESHPRLLVCDTVGFIQDLPHDLVASFRSTLDEALAASLLLFVVDASDPAFRDQLAVTRQVLAEIGAADIPSLLLLNKRDRLAPEALAGLAIELPEGMRISALEADDVASVRDAVTAFFERSMEETTLHVPYAAQALVGEIRRQARVISEEYDEAGVRLLVRAPAGVLQRLAARLPPKA